MGRGLLAAFYSRPGTNTVLFRGTRVYRWNSWNSSNTLTKIHQIFNCEELIHFLKKVFRGSRVQVEHFLRILGERAYRFEYRPGVCLPFRQQSPANSKLFHRSPLYQLTNAGAPPVDRNRWPRYPLIRLQALGAACVEAHEAAGIRCYR
jgi:hypothetical protein